MQGLPSKYNWYWNNNYSVKSSNPNLAGAMIGDVDGKTTVEVYPGTKKGTAIITATANDGSGKKATITVKVR